MKILTLTLTLIAAGLLSLHAMPERSRGISVMNEASAVRTDSESYSKCTYKEGKMKCDKKSWCKKDGKKCCTKDMSCKDACKEKCERHCKDSCEKSECACPSGCHTDGKCMSGCDKACSHDGKSCCGSAACSDKGCAKQAQE